MVKRKTDIRTNNDLQNTTEKSKDRATGTALKPGMNSCAPEGQAVPAPLITPVVFLANDTNVLLHIFEVFTCTKISSNGFKHLLTSRNLRPVVHREPLLFSVKHLLL